MSNEYDSSQDKFISGDGGREDPSFVLYPQAYLVNFLTFDTPKDGPESPAEPFGVFDKRIKISRMSPPSKTYARLAKIKGAYLPEAIISKILVGDTDPEKVSRFFLNMDNQKISALTPELRLYKISEELGVAKPFYFPVSTDYNFLANNQIDLSKSFTANAAAIESFSVTFTGKNPFQASRGFLEATLNVKVDNISMIFDEPRGFEGEYAPIADLFTIRIADGERIPGTGKTSSGNALENGKSCRIAATLGYSDHRTDVFTADEIEAIRSTFQTINLFYSTHDLNMQQDGSATISIKYTGFLEALKGESQYDLVANVAQKARLQKAKTGGETKKPVENIKDIGELRSVARKEAENKAKSTKKEEVLLPTTKDITSAFKDLINNLYTTGKIHLSPTNDVSTRRDKTILRSQYDLTDLDSTTDAAMLISMRQLGDDLLSGQLSDQLLEISNLDLKKLTPKKVKELNFNPFRFVSLSYISYFTLGDFLESYFKKIGDDIRRTLKRVESDKMLATPIKEKVKKRIGALLLDIKRFNVFMSDVIYVRKEEDTLYPEERNLNIADIPITIDTLYTVIFEEMVKDRRSFYDMYDFLTSMVPKLLTRSFNELPNADFINHITFTTTTYSARKTNRSVIKKGTISVADIPSPIQMASQSGVEKTDQIFIIHQKPSKYTRPLGSGNTERDSKNGIYHLRANQTTGLIKSINFSRIPSPAREAYMIARNGKIYDELRYAHNATVEMVGNNLFFPSCCVYINPDTLGFGDPRATSSAARRLGFGGYYVVGPVTTKFESGRLDTTLQLYFNSFPESDTQPNIKSGATGKTQNLKTSALTTAGIGTTGETE
ncbi:MAG: hypothetical protein CMF52_06485 [Legionellales bacterium]|nr:hypothetical protein [Legionellales bacterium]|tara:strand:+ start:377 stop:2887 length:2511 start_codon:yes stop_codon:yes gene_type:complete